MRNDRLEKFGITRNLSGKSFNLGYEYISRLFCTHYLAFSQNVKYQSPWGLKRDSRRLIFAHFVPEMLYFTGYLFFLLCLSYQSFGNLIFRIASLVDWWEYYFLITPPRRPYDIHTCPWLLPIGIWEYNVLIIVGN